jgi:uncharacterized membrane protein
MFLAKGGTGGSMTVIPVGTAGRPALKASITAVFTALIAAATMVFSIYVPATRGYFNIGETMVYTTALLFGPIIGAVAGGVGSMISDFMLGYPQYAFGTLIIKAAEGAIVGYLGSRVFKVKTGANWKIASSLIAILVGEFVGSIGATYYAGPTEASIGFPGAAQTMVTVEVPVAFWVLLAVLISVLIVSLGSSGQPRFSLLVIAVLAGGAEMVLGYFLYEMDVLGMGWAALAEVPFNLGQVSVGLLVSIPLVRAVWKRMPRL